MGSENVTDVIAGVTKEIQDEGAKSANTEATCENPSIQQIYADAHLTLQMANKVILEAMY